MDLNDFLLSKVMLFVSHPVADLLKADILYPYQSELCMIDKAHGSPYDRGQSDAYYGREVDPWEFAQEYHHNYLLGYYIHLLDPKSAYKDAEPTRKVKHKRMKEIQSLL